MITLRWWATRAGYWLRPYDDKHDRRVWRWRPRGCNADTVPTEVIEAAVRRYAAEHGWPGA